MVKFIYEMGHALGFVSRDLDDKFNNYSVGKHHEAKRLKAAWPRKIAESPDGSEGAVSTAPFV